MPGKYENNLRKKIESGQTIIGTHVSLADPSICEILGMLDFDYIWVDMEHTYLDCEKLYVHLNAARAVGASVIVRIPRNDFNTLKRVMEMGVDGIVFPMILSPEEAEEAIKATLYPPRGTRGFGPRKAIQYGLGDVKDYIARGSLDMCRFIQIEHVDAVNCLEELAKIEEIDGYIIGPCDLAGSIGKLGEHYGDEAAVLMKKIVRVLREHGKYIGLSTGDFSPEAIRYYSDMGVSMISAGADTDYLLYGARCACENLMKIHKRKELPGSEGLA